MKLKRVKTGDRKYNLIDVAVGDVVATAVQTGERGRDNYPWEWSLADQTVEFGDSGLKTGGSKESLKDIVDYVEANASKYGLTYRKDLRDKDAKRDAAIKAAKEEDEAKALSARRDELAREFDHKYAASYDLLGKPAQRAIDRIIELEGGPKPKPEALKKMVAKLDARNMRTSRGYVTKRDELIAILSEVSRLVPVSIVEEERPYSVQHKEISVTIKLGLTLERDLL